MRPNSIQTFEKLFLISIVIGVVNSLFSFDQMSAAFSTDPAMEDAGFGSGFIFTILAFSFGIPLLLWYFIARRASNVAKWILVILTGLGVAMTIPALGAGLSEEPLATVISVALTALQLVAIYYLFRPDAKAWFDSKGQTAANADIFD